MSSRMGVDCLDMLVDLVARFVQYLMFSPYDPISCRIIFPSSCLVSRGEHPAIPHSRRPPSDG